MGPTEINGLPAHVLLVHVVVVLIPITALLLLASAIWPAARHRIGVVLPIVALISLISVPITAEAGQWLAGQLNGGGPLVARHAHLADQLLPWTMGLFAVSAAVWAVHRFLPAARSGTSKTALTIGLAVLSLVVAVGSVVAVYRVGDSGAKAAWDGVISAQ
ncbi:DUF2231 domain-containing protein [Cryptosporangium aurantiacum]|uniref:DUF2231 domain-containing protein n=1 Tax=Cryptosporangium aurantiacum TaxID=134849 RepID=A0A1M7MJ92_9ACTN|nr:DUF2231 domain-containing protein [Cryptosporangium aurantiacum]SHM90496.1 hypothetical protein SAMN05443668_102131 [Cryptosporangium aurantiacum]